QGEGLFGQRYSQISAELNLHEQYLRDLQSVASRVAPEIRRANLSFGHHRVIASLEPQNQKKILDLAEKHGWSRDDLTERKIVFRLDAEEQDQFLARAHARAWTNGMLSAAVEQYQKNLEASEEPGTDMGVDMGEAEGESPKIEHLETETLVEVDEGFYHDPT